MQFNAAPEYPRQEYPEYSKGLFRAVRRTLICAARVPAWPRIAARTASGPSFTLYNASTCTAFPHSVLARYNASARNRMIIQGFA